MINLQAFKAGLRGVDKEAVAVRDRKTLDGMIDLIVGRNSFPEPIEGVKRTLLDPATLKPYPEKECG